MQRSIAFLYINETSSISKRTELLPVPPVLGLIAAIGAAAALLATYWDDSWHTDKGRDEFAIPPHLLLYGGVLLASLAVAAWGVRSWRSAGWGMDGLRTVLSRPALLLAGLGGGATLASGPIDAAWHETYGRDAVLWSPPHLAAVAGTLALSVGLLAGLRQTTGRGAGAARILAAAGVLGALQVPVLEYDSDVPQFSTFWFLPVVALGMCVAAALLDDLLPRRSHLLAAGAVYTALRAVAVGFLALLGFSLTAVPPVFPLVLVVAALHARPLALRLLVAGALAPLVWWPFLELQSAVTTVVPVAQLPGAVVLGGLAGLLVAVVHGDLRVSGPRAPLAARAMAVVAVVIVVLAGSPPTAWAHDPGQGQEVREGELRVQREGGSARVAMLLPGRCDGLVADSTVARRAGRTLRGDLSLRDTSGGCRLTGTVRGLGSGRWFVYAEARDGEGRPLEAWLPASEDQRAAETRPLYLAVTVEGGAGRTIAGAVLLSVVTLLLVASLRLAKRSAAAT